MKIFVLVVLAGMSSCPRMSPEASARIEAGYRLRECLRLSSKQICRQQISVYCRLNGLEYNCGEDTAWDDPSFYSPTR
jgi:hypothetical protein